MNDIKLKPCKCGEDVRIESKPLIDIRGIRFYITCRKCGCEMQSDIVEEKWKFNGYAWAYELDKNELNNAEIKCINAWNRRINNE